MPTRRPLNGRRSATHFDGERGRHGDARIVELSSFGRPRDGVRVVGEPDLRLTGSGVGDAGEAREVVEVDRFNLGGLRVQLEQHANIAGAALMFAVSNQSTWLHVTACEVRVLLSTVMRAVFCVTLLSVKHPAHDAATNEAFTAAVISRRPIGHLQTHAGLSRTLFLSACARPRE